MPLHTTVGIQTAETCKDQYSHESYMCVFCNNVSNLVKTTFIKIDGKEVALQRWY